MELLVKLPQNTFYVDDKPVEYAIDKTKQLKQYFPNIKYGFILIDEKDKKLFYEALSIMDSINLDSKQNTWRNKINKKYEVLFILNDFKYFTLAGKEGLIFSPIQDITPEDVEKIEFFSFDFSEEKNAENKKRKIEIYKNTLELCKNNHHLKTQTISSIEKTASYLQDSKFLDIHYNQHAKTMNVIVSNKKFLDAACEYSLKGQRVAVVNLSKDLEFEDNGLYCCTNLFPVLNSIQENKKQIFKEELYYIPQITVFKTSTQYPRLLNEDQWFNIDVISNSSFELKNDTYKDNELYKYYEFKWHQILDIATLKKRDVVVIKDFGCKQSNIELIQIISKALRNILKDYKNTFKTIEFAFDGINCEEVYSILKKQMEGWWLE